ncbi:hypothetical protein QBC45DRAFT_394199 [Copromyces sp. CBS 386.78]|nr:hypothetical protein QBC45DRAFT_394199 [Copromyces sp. CBS 386.78]
MPPPRASNGSGTIALADLRVINLQHQHNSVHADDHKSKAAQTVSLPVSKSRSYVRSVASDGPVHVYRDKGKGEGYYVTVLKG